MENIYKDGVIGKHFVDDNKYEVNIMRIIYGGIDIDAELRK